MQKISTRVNGIVQSKARISINICSGYPLVSSNFSPPPPDILHPD